MLMPRYRRPNARNTQRDENGIHVAELIEEPEDMSDISELEEVRETEDAKEVEEGIENAFSEEPLKEVEQVNADELIEAKEEKTSHAERKEESPINEPVLDIRDIDMQDFQRFPSRNLEMIRRQSNNAINYSNVRVLHAAAGYGPVFVIIGTKTIATDLAFGKVSPYERIIDGFRTVMIFSASAPRTPLLNTVIPFIAGTRITLAIVNSPRGLQIIPIHDNMCVGASRDRACFRVGNLTFDDGPFDLVLSDGSMVFSDVKVKEVTQWNQAVPGDYEFYVKETPMQGEGAYQFNFYLRMYPNMMYTACIIGGYYSSVPIQVIIIEN